MSAQNDYERGLAARRITQEALYKEAWSVLDASWLQLLADPATTEEQAKEVRRLLIAGRKLRAYFERVMGEGVLAADEIKRQEQRKSLRERFRIL